jgi:hypothetical protein
VSHAGGVLLVETIRASGLDRELSAALGRWRRPQARHDPAKVVLDLAVTLALGGDCLADIATVRAAPAVFGPVASDATVSRTITGLAGDADRVLAALAKARALVRGRVWTAAGGHAPNAAGTATVDLDATLVTAHSDKEGATPTFKMGFGHHPLLGFVDHGEDGTGEMVAGLLREGRAGSNTAADHITVVRDALAQLPGISRGRPGRKVLIRADGAGATHGFLDWLSARGLGFSVGWTLSAGDEQLIRRLPAAAWTPAYDSASGLRDGAFVAELTGLLDLSKWPKGLRVIVRSERPHPGAQLRITDIDGNRITAFATNTATGQLADLELRHRRRARCEDRIRQAKDCGLRNLPLQGMDQNRIWLAIVALAGDLIAWTQMLGFAGHEARRWEHKRLRHRLLSAAGRIARHARTTMLHLPAGHRWSPLIHTGLLRIAAAAPG